MSWVVNVLLGLDQLGNALVGGSPDETISSRTANSWKLLRGLLNLFQRDHSLKSLEYTPWGTADSHSLYPVHPSIASDWNALICVLESDQDLDHWPVETLRAANRAQIRLNTWGTRDSWKQRMERDLDVGDRFQR